MWAENSGVDWMGEGGICVFGESGSYDEGGGVEEMVRGRDASESR